MALLACAGGAIAQSQDEEPAGSPTTIDEIVVTASRIDRAGFTAPTPDRAPDGGRPVGGGATQHRRRLE